MSNNDNAEQPERRISTRKHPPPQYLGKALAGNEFFELLDDYVLEEGRPKRRKHKRSKNVSARPPRPSRDQSSQPRWYNQMYLMFLALRQSPGYTATRRDLLKRAVELDEKISKERGLTRAFRGKTPLNSASALLTNNGDRHFIQFRPPGSKYYHFKLAYEPGDLENAKRAYDEWVDVLINIDWPLCFCSEQQAPSSAITDNSIEEDDDLPLVVEILKDAVPKSWKDIVEVRPSSIPNAGNGLFAARMLPGGIPLGFYFGVPMTEDEFDSLKETKGMSSHYSIMYRKTVLDATDPDGMPYTDPEGPVYCPFHFMNEDRKGSGNIVFQEGIKVNQVICMTKRTVGKGEELFVSYGDEVDRSHWTKTTTETVATITVKAGHLETQEDGSIFVEM